MYLLAFVRSDRYTRAYIQHTYIQIHIFVRSMRARLPGLYGEHISTSLDVWIVLIMFTFGSMVNANLQKIYTKS